MGVSQICLRIKWRLSQFCIQQSKSSYDCIDVISVTPGYQEYVASKGDVGLEAEDSVQRD